MDWNKFNTYGESKNHAFEVMCNLLFEKWCIREYGDNRQSFYYVNGNGGDGGVEAICKLKDGSIIAIHSKWFRQSLNESQIKQIQKSFETAIKVYPGIKKYIVCIPRDLTSTRNTKGNRLTSNAESDKWDSLLSFCKELNPDIDVILWSETAILSELQRTESVGMTKFWFDNSEITENVFENALKKANVSWARTKYIPDLYLTGKIHNVLCEHINDIEVAKEKLNAITSYINSLKNLRRSLTDVIDFVHNPIQIINICDDIETVKDLITKLEDTKQIIQSGGDFIKEELLFELKCTDEDLNEEIERFNKYYLFCKAKTDIRDVRNSFYNCIDLSRKANSNILILLGNPGTGKTAGIVNETTQLYQSKRHLPLLISAKRIEDNRNWKDIITDYLGISNNWDENEIFSALSMAAMVRYKNVHQPETVAIKPKVVICVDGIDESKNRSAWIERIYEAKTFEKNYPNIKFVFLSRNSLFKDKEEKEGLQDDICYLPIQGDVKIDELLNKYVNYYNININGHQWIRNVLRTPLSVKLFCDLYTNQELSISSNHQLIITNLIKKKFDEMDKAFLNEMDRIVERKPITNTLRNISKLFVDSEKIMYSNIVSSFPKTLLNYADDVLLFLQKEGIIDIRSDENDNDTFIYWGIQPTLDYLIADLIFERIQNGESIDTSYSKGIYQMLSILLIENKNTLISYVDCVKDDTINTFELDCFALINSSPDIALLFVDIVKKTMSESRTNFRAITNEVILPVSKDDKHPLGAMLLDEFLNSFDSPANRDTWWSIPANLRFKDDCDWRTNVEFDYDYLSLDNKDNYLGRPLIIAWTLSNVSRGTRAYSSQKLLLWAIENEIQYIKLLEKFKNEKDQQILEELFAIAYGLSLRQDTSHDYLERISHYMLEEVFSEDGLIKYQNTALRYYAKGIIEIAISRGILENNIIGKVKPPYKYEPKLLPLNENSEILSSSRMIGYDPIDYDLSRYALCDQLECYFSKDRKTEKYTKDTAMFLKKYSNYYSDIPFKLDGFIISMVYQYVLDCGWNQELFLGKNKFDSVIKSTYYSATHGSKSEVMSIGEKYTWLAKHNIEAIFANEMPVSRNGNTEFIDDYGVVDSFYNPYQAYVIFNHAGNGDWIHMDELTIPLSNEYKECSIERWMKHKELPNFRKWIFDNDGFTILNAYCNCINEDFGLEETLWISSGLCSDVDFNDFISGLDYSLQRNEFLITSDFYSYIDTDYCSPQEVCLIESKREVDDILLFNCNNKQIQIQKTMVECTYSDHNEISSYFTMPGKLVRKLLSITYGDGYSYFDRTGMKVAKYELLGNNLNNQQRYLCVDSSKLAECTKKEKFKVFWLFRVYRSPNSRARESFNNIMHSTDFTYIVWEDDDGSIQSKELSDDEQLLSN